MAVYNVNGREITVTHIMDDGSIRDSVEGYPIPTDTEVGRRYYELEARIARNIARRDMEAEMLEQE